MLFTHIFGSELCEVCYSISFLDSLVSWVYGPSHRGNGEETQQKYEDLNIPFHFYLPSCIVGETSYSGFNDSLGKRMIFFNIFRKIFQNGFRVT